MGVRHKKYPHIQVGVHVLWGALGSQAILG